MSDTEQQPQDHPGPDWFLSWEDEVGSCGGFKHPSLGFSITFGDGMRYDFHTRAEAVARCRAISAAALAWERKKLSLTECLLCGALGREAHVVNCRNNPNTNQ